jgi:hypothetical protein
MLSSNVLAGGVGDERPPKFATSEDDEKALSRKKVASILRDRLEIELAERAVEPSARMTCHCS